MRTGPGAALGRPGLRPFQGTALLPYKILYFDADGALLYTGHMESESDEEALDRTAHLHHPYDLELWRGDRRIRRFERAGTACRT